MDIKLSIAADYKEASKAFNELANESEATREKIEKFTSAFQTEQLDKFVDKQKLLIASLTGTRGEVSAMTTAQKNYEKEIERLIRSGLDPESDAIKKLRNEHDKLADKIKKTNDVQKAQSELMGHVEKAALGFYAAIGAAAAGIGVATQKMAEAGNEYAKTARVIGMTAETFQELDYAAKMSGVDNLDSSLQKLNKSVADVKSGTGALTSYLKENDQQLLTQIQNVNSNEEAFNLLMDAIGRAPNEFSRAELATAAFGKSGQELILLANEGADGIAKLREEAQRYGVISNEAAANSEAFLDAQSRLKASVSGVANELTAKLLPGLTESITKLADFIASIDNWDAILSGVGYALAGVTAGLTAFLIIAKGSTVIHALATAFKALTAAITANPIGAIAVVITAVLIPALIALYKNWDTISTYLQQGIARLEYAFKWLGSVIKEGLVVAFNTVKSAAVSLVDFIYGNIIRAVGNMLEVLGKLPFVGDLFQAAASKVTSLGNAIGNMAAETKRASEEAIANAHAEQNATEERLKNTLASIDAESKARRAAIEAQKKGNAEVVDDAVSSNEAIIKNENATQNEITKVKADGMAEQIKTLSARLNEMGKSEKQIETEQIKDFEKFLNERADLEQVNGLERIAWLKEMGSLLLESDKLSGDERIALEKSINNLILVEDKKLLANEQKILSDRLSKIPLTEEQTLNALTNQFKNFLNERAKLQSDDTTERINWLNNQYTQLSNVAELNDNERLAAEKAINVLLLEEAERLNEERAALEEGRISNLQDRLNEQLPAEAVLHEQLLEQFSEYLERKFELEKIQEEKRQEWLLEQQKILLEKMELNENEEAALNEAVNQQIYQSNVNYRKKNEELLNKQLDAVSKFFSGVQELAELGSKKSLALLVVEKAAASAQAAINSYVAFTRALADFPQPYSYIAAAGVLAAGLAQQIKIVSTAIPSAETGGRFIVPNSPGSDSAIMRVNQGEEVEITPRGMVGNSGIQNIIVQIEKQTIFEVVNEGIESGDILIQAANF
jgi:hypothetical protein